MRVAAILLLAVIMITAVHALSDEGLLGKAEKIYRELSELRAAGVDVSNLVRELGKSLAAWSKGEISDADLLNVLNSLESKISQLRNVSGEAASVSALIKYGLLASTLATPLITYFALPRVCAWAWYLSRKRWVVDYEDR